ncbi:TnsD family Tn7-like transposition protein [Variovorax sp. J31P179]|uniref:TnsD family Tn7-like transposition protein n=1 Tax=Variovorax sp. J31P179 TaxID=3053508 RepID=UPI002576080C|nr:TnsD family Tn7-like transposition protein [Variovorax sp. J31P179]MDM0081694.1 TnsD family Tn7-like transposition protein [Variovorax sp. J31P179]
MNSPNPLPYATQHMDDETLYGYLGRVNAYNCAGSSGRFLRAIFGDSKAVSSADLPSRLIAMLERWPEVSPYPSVAEVIENATQYPYHRPFIPTERWNELVRRATDGPGSSLKTWLGLVAQRFSATTTFRSCVECDRLSWDAEGVLYWHRSHLLPGVVICPVHHTPLVEHFIQSKDSARSALRLPPLSGSPVVIARSALGPLTNFAVTSYDVLRSSSEPMGDQCTPTYLAKLRDMGLCNGAGRIRWPELSSLVVEANRGFHTWALGGRITERTGTVLRWIYALLRGRPEKLSHPATHIVLINLLFGSFDAYQAAAGVVAAEAVDDPPRRPLGPGPVARLDSGDCNVSCRKAATALGVSVTTVVKRRRALGLPIAERRKTLTPDRIAFVRRQLGSGALPAIVAQEAHLSPSSVYRIRSSMVLNPPAGARFPRAEMVRVYRKRWTNTGLMSSAVKQRRMIDGAAYAWLYRHDHEWLTVGPGHPPPPPSRNVRRFRIDWEERDESYARRIAAVSGEERAREPRIRLSVSALIRVTGPQSSIRAHLCLLPRTKEALRINSESIRDFQKLRYFRAAASLANHDGAFPQWKALKLAGLHQPPPADDVKPERTG